MLNMDVVNESMIIRIKHIPPTIFVLSTSPFKEHNGPIHTVRITASEDRTIRSWHPVCLDSSCPSTLRHYIQRDRNINTSEFNYRLYAQEYISHPLS